MSSDTQYKAVIGFIIFIVICFIVLNDNIREAVKSMIVHTPATAVAIFTNPDGRIQFTEDIIGKCTIIDISMRGMKPGVYALHIYEHGDISDINNLNNHYNPHGSRHGDIDHGHVGDLGNITANESGEIDHRVISHDIKLNSPYSIYGRAIAFRSEPDDFITGTAGSITAAAIIVV